VKLAFSPFTLRFFIAVPDQTTKLADAERGKFTLTELTE